MAQRSIALEEAIRQHRLAAKRVGRGEPYTKNGRPTEEEKALYRQHYYGTRDEGSDVLQSLAVTGNPDLIRDARRGK